MRISTDQPFPSTATADAHTPSHDGSSLVSLKSTPSYCSPAALTPNSKPVR